MVCLIRKLAAVKVATLDSAARAVAAVQPLPPSAAAPPPSIVWIREK